MRYLKFDHQIIFLVGLLCSFLRQLLSLPSCRSGKMEKVVIPHSMHNASESVFFSAAAQSDISNLQSLQNSQKIPCINYP
ncbi:hypothetical protein QBC38DRAFT_282309 [Podospora fimiseda]|uniref:Uncharacterized protein n=1 Tax=Podospora fimiseda TaxID=252190 RepID=A0AAN7BKK5_9PEZI|nr:hypothetical protein QBC38DRAFT_282309 [Podospora fimiseda]